MKNMSEKIILEWGKAGQGQPPNAKEIEDTLEKIKDKAAKSNVFSLYGASNGMIQYLKDRLDPTNAVIKVIDTGWVLIGIDEKTVQSMYDSI